jgi:hypothetical protein
MRMGVRDCLDKNHDLHRHTFLAAVRKQLEKVRPAKRERLLYRSLSEFRDSLEKILPLVRTATALNDPVPFTDSVRHLFRFLMSTTQARDGVLLVRSYDAARQPPETCRAYDVNGRALELDLVPFQQSLAGMVVSLQEPSAMARLDQSPATLGAKLQPFEQGHRYVLAAPLAISAGLSVVLELFDKRATHDGDRNGAFTEEDRRLVGAAAEFGAEMMKQALADRQLHTVLLDAVGAALHSCQNISEVLQGTAATGSVPRDQPPAAPIMDQIRDSLAHSGLDVVDADQTLKLAELLRVIALRHGREATEYCIQLLEGVSKLLGTLTGMEAKP